MKASATLRHIKTKRMMCSYMHFIWVNWSEIVAYIHNTYTHNPRRVQPFPISFLCMSVFRFKPLGTNNGRHAYCLIALIPSSEFCFTALRPPLFLGFFLRPSPRTATHPYTYLVYARKHVHVAHGRNHYYLRLPSFFSIDFLMHTGTLQLIYQCEHMYATNEVSLILFSAPNTI